MEKTMEDIFFEAGEIDSLFMGHVPINLWRALKLDNFTGEIFKPIIKTVVYNNGRVRKPDIKTFNKNGSVYVKAQPRKGVSLMSRSGAFKGNWSYYIIPAGTKIPPGLVISRDKYSPHYELVHYTISPNHDMLLETYLKLLCELASNALVAAKHQTEGVAKYDTN